MTNKEISVTVRDYGNVLPFKLYKATIKPD